MRAINKGNVLRGSTAAFHESHQCDDYVGQKLYKSIVTQQARKR